MVAVLASAGCETAADVVWANKTDTDIWIYLGDDRDKDEFEVFIPSHSTEGVMIIRHIWNDIVVGRDGRGDVVFRQDITWEELERHGFRFVITEEMLLPTAAPR